ncbi:MAG: hypothetical protein M3O71_21575 [Bacteroidota bacterium]|nr:hypothetical protein [Bacteroidota bacterium]
MVKASALYIVIIIALVIGVICSSLIVAAYFYREQYQRKLRFDQLENNLNSGVNILTGSSDTSFATEKTFSLFGGDADSISLRKLHWGVYDIGVAKALIQKDTLYKTFSLAYTIDSAKWAAVYLIDEDRPFSLSGKTTIRGDAYLPKAGIQTAYIDNQSYEGDKRLVIGKKNTSERKLPALDDERLNELKSHFNADAYAGAGTTLPERDTVENSFLKPVSVFDFKKEVVAISNIKLSGNLIIHSDTTVTIDSTSVLKNVQVYARAIIVKSGFRGNCQLFASDSIRVEQNCTFQYPSCLGLLRFDVPPVLNSQQKISMGKNTVFNGLIFSYDKTNNPLKPLIALEKKVKVTGQIYSQGILQLVGDNEIDGSVFTGRFWYKSSSSLYENYLINSTIDTKALSPYYLTSGLLPVATKRKKVLQWLEAN